MQGVTAKRGIELLDLELLRLKLLVTRGGVTRRGLAFLARFRAFDGDDFARHRLFLLFRLFLFFVGLFDFGHAHGIYRTERAKAALTERALTFQLRLGCHGETRPRNRFEARLGNRLASQFANTVRVPLDALERFLDLEYGVLVRG